MTEKEIEETEEFAEDDTLFDAKDTPNPNIELKGPMGTIEGITKKYQEENEEPNPVQPILPNPASQTTEGRLLEGLIGASAFANLDAIYRNRGQKMDELITIEELPLIGHIEIQNNKEGNPKYLVFYDESHPDSSITIRNCFCKYE